MFQLIAVAIALGIGFACGYGVREAKSRRRRVRAREEYLRGQEQKRYDQSGGSDFATMSMVSSPDCKFQPLTEDEKKEVNHSALSAPPIC